MNQNPPIEEAKTDLEQTRLDVQLLADAALAMNALVCDSKVENKPFYRSVLLHLERDMQHGNELISKIRTIYKL